MTDGPDSDNRILATEHEYGSVSMGGIATDTLRIDLESMDYDSLEITGAVPVEDLEALADKWEWDKNGLIHAEAHARDQCAQELRTLLEDHQ